MITEKKCTICKQVKPVSEFYKGSHSKDGYYSRCKICHGKAVKDWQENNSEHFKQIKKVWKKAHHREHSLHNKKWASENPDKVQEMMKEWRQKNPEYGSNWRKNNLDKIRNYEHVRRARMRGNGGNLTTEEWHTILNFYDHRCLCCGRTDVKLTIDHVLPIFLGGKHTIDNVQPLCGPCNSSKRDKHIDYRKELYHETSRD
jgi:5-methylcytosine-specific restriction endonuclease McrA